MDKFNQEQNNQNKVRYNQDKARHKNLNKAKSSQNDLHQKLEKIEKLLIFFILANGSNTTNSTV